MSEEHSFKIYGVTQDGKTLISAEEVQLLISRELAIAGEEIEQLKKENEEITNLLIKHSDILGGQPRHDINNLLDKFNKGE